MTIQLTRREALDRSLAFLFCAIFVAMVGPFDWIIGATFIDAQMRHQSFRKEARHEVAANTSDAPTGDNRFQRNDAEGTREASVPKAINREAGAVPQADRATPCRAIPSPVSTGSERSDLRVILPTSGAVQVGGSHGVRRELEPAACRGCLLKAPGLALSSSGIRGEASMVRAQGEASPKDSKAFRIAWTSLDTGGRGHEARNIPFDTARQSGVTLWRDRGFASWSQDKGQQARGTDPRTARREPPRDLSLVTSLQGGLYEITAYSHGCTMPRSGRERPAQRGADGRWPIPELTVAADTSLHPFGTEVLIEGLGFRRVGDRGHAIKGRRLDLFLDSCEAAREFGRRWLSVTVVPAETTRWASR